ncbi:strawberry notch C-terminal domain-containing protein [Paraburkholderia sediminicola]|uniref:strawberry notch C-terminal domain-containing protein n=1 Tax=Paraburkholderia sediminicola TaxID=458836 RepID=UPI0038BBE178
MPLGLNFKGQQVFEGEDGRFIADVAQGNVHEKDSPPSRASFLYADSPEDLALCAQGFVREIAGGKICRFDDLKKFASVVTQIDARDIVATPRLREVQEAVEAALVRHLATKARSLDRRDYALAIRLEEGQPTMAARTSTSVTLQQYSTPLPVSVAVQRIFGNADGKTFLEPTIGNGSLVCALPGKPAISAFDLDERRVSAASVVRPGVRAALGDATEVDFKAVNGGVPYDCVVSNPPFGGLPAARTLSGLKIRRIDHLILMRALQARKDDGLAVFIIGGDSYHFGNRGKVEGGSRHLFNWLADHYETEVVEVDGGLYSKQGASAPIRIVVVGRKGKSSNQVPDQLTVIDDHDTLFDWSSQMATKFSVEEPAEELEAAPTTPIESGVSEAVEVPDSEAASTAAAPAQAPENNVSETEENTYQSPYASRSRVSEATAMIPRNLATPTRQALSDIAEEYGDIDEFVASQLDWSVEDLARYVAPEQVDAIALAIHSSARGRGLLEADQTGLGKGRVMAAMARYSVLRDRRVVFLTETPTLFTDFWRDIKDIGSEDLFNPLIVNDGVAIYDPITGAKLVPASSKSVVDNAIASGELDPAYNLVLATYSQFNRDTAKSAKARWIPTVSRDAALLLDEAHNAAGESNTGKNIGLAIESASFVAYSSATAMKAGKNVMLYSKLFPETVDMGMLPETLAAGGEVLQEVLSGMLARDGVLIRREHDLSNLTFSTVTDTVRERRNVELSDRLADILEYMNYLSGDINQLVNERNRSIKKLLEKVPEKERKGNRMGAINVNFGSRLFAIYRQFLMAIKTDLAAERAVQALHAGKKPVIVLENTMESLLNDLVLRSKPDILDPDELAAGTAAAALLGRDVELGQDMSFRDVLHRMLHRLTYYCETGRYGDVTKVPVTSDESLELVRLIAGKIDEFPELPVSPIDEIKRRIEAAGFVCDELSGRKLQIVERDGTVFASPLAERPKPQIVKDFVTGTTDALVLTNAGSTGISLHAGEKFPDQRQRVMIELQSAADVNRRIQFFGRVNRRGQTSAPEIETLSSGLIGEARPIAMQNAKLRKLSANTTANQDNAALDRTVPDFINSIGDEVAYRYLDSNPSIATRLDIDMDSDEDNMRSESYYINKLTSRLVMLRNTEQERIYGNLTTEYRRVVKELDAKGINPLKARELDVRAREVAREVFESGNPHSDSAFSLPVYVKTIEFDVKVDPMRSRVVRDLVREGQASVKDFEVNAESRENEEFFMGLKAALATSRKHLLEGVLNKKQFESVDAALAAKNVNPVQKMLARLSVLDRVLDGLYVGAVARFTNNDGDPELGIVTRIEVPQRAKELHLLGGYELSIAAPGREHLIERTLYSLQEDAQFRLMPKGSFERELYSGFDSAAAGVHVERRLVLDGNLFKAAQIAANAKMGGSVIYTNERGHRLRGVLLTKGMEMKRLNSLPVRLESPSMCFEVIKRHPELRLRSSTAIEHDRSADLSVVLDGADVLLEVPGTKGAGGRYFSDDELIKVTGPFAGSRATMSARFPVENVHRALTILYRGGTSLYAPAEYRTKINELSKVVYTNESQLDNTAIRTPSMAA